MFRTPSACSACTRPSSAASTTRPSTTSPRSTGGSWTRCSIWQIWRSGQCNGVLTWNSIRTAKKYGFQDKTIRVWHRWTSCPWRTTARLQDGRYLRCRVSRQHPYFYSTYDRRQRGRAVHQMPIRAGKKKSPRLWFRPHPHRSGHRVRLLLCPLRLDLKKHGCEAILVNNNPETVSTDFDTGDRLYFRPAEPRERGQHHRDRKAGRLRGAVRRPDRHQAGKAYGRDRSCPFSAPRRMPSTKPRTANALMSCWSAAASPAPRAAPSSIWTRLWPLPRRSACRC